MHYSPQRDGTKKDDFERFLRKAVVARDYAKNDTSITTELVSSTVPIKQQRPIVFRESRKSR